MSIENNTLNALLTEYQQQRDKNHRIEQDRIAEVCERSEHIRDLVDARWKAFDDGKRQAFATPDRSGEVVEQLMARIGEINAGLRNELAVLGYPEDYLQPVYRCPICRDTGYVGEVVRDKCSCLKQRLMDAANDGERAGGLGAHSFEQFDLDIFPDDLLPGERCSQRVYMGRVRRMAERYAEDFPDTSKTNLLFCGPPGLGKTFLADCIASRVMDRAYLVRRVTSYRMADIMKRNAFDGSEARAANDLMTCDLLFIDDLGAEPKGRNTSEYLFEIINERNNAGRHTIISTNLAPHELATVYGERVASRLLDTSRTIIVRFYGRDLRLRRDKG